MDHGRAHRHQPIHFTGVSNIAATFDFRVNAGATPALTGEASKTLMPVFGGSVAENPTISIVPIEGEVRSFFGNSGTEANEAALKLAKDARRPLAGSIGPQTSETMKKVGMPVDFTAKTPSLESLVDALVAKLGSAK